MKSYSICFFLIAIFLFSCQHDPPKPTDQIFYTYLFPDAVVQSVRHFTPSEITWMTCPEIPHPTDSTSHYNVDINNNNTPDFRIEVTHRFYGSCGHCMAYIYQVSIEGLQEDCFVANSGTDDQIPMMFSAGDIVDKDQVWANGATLFYSYFCASEFEADFDDCFIGTRVGNSFGYIHVVKMPGNGISIVEHGHNLTAGRSIECGQKG